MDNNGQLFPVMGKQGYPDGKKEVALCQYL